MHEIACPNCISPSQYNLNDAVLTCTICSTSFRYDRGSGIKEIYADHFIIPNTLDHQAIRETIIEWLRRMHHSPSAVEQEYVVREITGASLPFWVASVDAHTLWKGLVKRENKNSLKVVPGSEFLYERGEFRRSYHWAVSARRNVCETWGVSKLHSPQEPYVSVDWDGFPLDSTFTQGRLDEPKISAVSHKEKTAYDLREFFNFRYANGIPIVNPQVTEDEALRRSKRHIEQYHYQLARGNVDHLIDIQTELEITGIQLMHLPFWHASYQLRVKPSMGMFFKPEPKNILVEGASKGILKGELAVRYNDKARINAIVCSLAGIFMLILASTLHPLFLFLSLFCFGVAGYSVFLMQRPISETREPTVVSASSKAASKALNAKAVA